MVRDLDFKSDSKVYDTLNGIRSDYNGYIFRRIDQQS